MSLMTTFTLTTFNMTFLKYVISNKYQSHLLKEPVKYALMPQLMAWWLTVASCHSNATRFPACEFFRSKTMLAQEKHFLWRGARIQKTIWDPLYKHMSYCNMVGMMTFFSQEVAVRGDGDFVCTVVTDSHIECSSYQIETYSWCDVAFCFYDKLSVNMEQVVSSCFCTIEVVSQQLWVNGTLGTLKPHVVVWL